MLSSTLKILFITLCFGAGAAHAQKPAFRPADMKAVDENCKPDAKEAGCLHLTMAKGLGKCISKYRKTHKTVHRTEPCKAALMALRQNRRGGMGPKGPLKSEKTKGNPEHMSKEDLAELKKDTSPEVKKDAPAVPAKNAAAEKTTTPEKKKAQ